MKRTNDKMMRQYEKDDQTVKTQRTSSDSEASSV